MKSFVEPEMTFKGHSTSSAMCWWGPWLITDPLSLTAVTVWPLAGLQQPHRWERHRHTSVRLKPRFKYRQRWTLISVSGNEFQTVGAEQRKVHLVKSVLVNGSSSRPSGTADERSVRSLTRALMWRLSYVGDVALLRLLKINTATLYSILCWMGNQCSSRSRPNGRAWDRLGV